MAQKFLTLMIRAYQVILRPLLPPACRFYPTCSNYAIAAIRRFGPFQGTCVAIRRVLRCHPWNAGGFDPVSTGSPGRRPAHAGRAKS